MLRNWTLPCLVTCIKSIGNCVSDFHLKLWLLQLYLWLWHSCGWDKTISHPQGNTAVAPGRPLRWVCSVTDQGNTTDSVCQDESERISLFGPNLWKDNFPPGPQKAHSNNKSKPPWKQNSLHYISSLGEGWKHKQHMVDVNHAVLSLSRSSDSMGIGAEWERTSSRKVVFR